MIEKKVLVVGIDGMAPELFELLVKKNIFSNLKKIREEGTSSCLESTIPPITGPAWATFATGTNPGKHGIFNFAMPNNSLLDCYIVSSGDIAVKTFYELLEEIGKKSILINLPVSWPPLTDNPTITSILTRGNNFIYPETLKKSIPKLKEYRIVPKTIKKNKKSNFFDSSYINSIRDLERIRFETAIELMKFEWDFFFLLFSGSDWVSHYAYNELITETAEGVLWEFFKEIDRYIGKIYENIKGYANMFILSDHGFRVVKKRFNINEWLARENLLKRTQSKRLKEESHAFIESEKKRDKKRFDLTIFAWLRNIPWMFKILRSVYKMIEKYLPVSLVTKEAIDTAKTSAYCINQESWGIYLNLENKFINGRINNYERGVIADDIKFKLKKVNEIKSDERVIKDIFFREEIYVGSEIYKAPDLIMIPNDNWAIYPGLEKRELFTNRNDNDHDLYGIFLAIGPDISRKKTLDGISIQDIPVTILHFLDCPIINYMDGKVIMDIISDKSEFKNKKIEYSVPDKNYFRKRQPIENIDDVEVFKRLKDLGYLD